MAQAGLRSCVAALVHGQAWKQALCSLLAPSRRPFCTGGELDEREFHRLADDTLEHLQDQLDDFVENRLDAGDVSYEDGVLTLALGDKGTYVLNKQAPNKQIWSSSPVSGPVRYDWTRGQWVYLRDGHEMKARLSAELSELCGKQVQLD